MLTYNLLFLAGLIGIFNNIKMSTQLVRFNQFFFIIILSLVIGLRHEVGGDWLNYYLSYSKFNELNAGQFIEILSLNEPGFKTLIWVSSKISTIYFMHIANLLSAFIFLFSLFYFINRFPFTSLLFYISIPFLLIIVAMGYTRQSIGLAFFMLGILSLNNNKNFNFVILILIGTLFHKATIFCFIFFIYKNLNLKKLNRIIYMSILAVLFFILFNDIFSKFLENFLQQEALETTGARIKILINLLFGITYYLIRKNWNNKLLDIKIMDTYLILTIIFFAVSIFLSPVYIAAADRLSIFIYPINLVVIANYFLVIKKEPLKSGFLFILISVSYIYFITWAIFGSYSRHWLPYQNVLFI
tara:strand:- start:9453 stop:10523 length:1071 start_codon:yes stop_codon:yes gene_type:complete